MSARRRSFARAIGVALCAAALWPATARADTRVDISAAEAATARQEKEIVLIRMVASQELRPQAMAVNTLLWQQLWMQTNQPALLAGAQGSFRVPVVDLQANHGSPSGMIVPAAFTIQRSLSRGCRRLARSVTMLHVATLSSLLTVLAEPWATAHPQLDAPPSHTLRYATQPSVLCQDGTNGPAERGDQRTMCLPCRSLAFRARATPTWHRGANRIQGSLAAARSVNGQPGMWRGAWLHWLQSRAPPAQ